MTMVSPEHVDPFGEKATRSLRYKEFVIGMLDDRQHIEKLLRERATTQYSTYKGYRDDDYITPPYLQPLLRGSDSSTVVDFDTKQVGNTVTVTNVTIATENHRPVFIHEEETTGFETSSHAIAEQGSVTLQLESGSTELALRSFLPLYIPGDVTTRQLIDAMSMLSPEKDEVVEYFGVGTDFTAEIRYTDIETYNDSIQMLEVMHQKIHPSGKVIATRLRITESLLGRMKETRAQSVEQRLELQAQRPHAAEPQFTIVDILNEDGRIVEVHSPTQRHIDDIQAALTLLKRARP